MLKFDVGHAARHRADGAVHAEGTGTVQGQRGLAL
jgi:hypothetical protein